ncbi:MAG: hypothetical protein AAGD11_20870 [Planctomycetota bacterium]
MPVESHIFVTLDSQLDDEIVGSLTSDISESLGKDRLLDYDGRGGLFREKKEDYKFLPEGLPHTGWILHLRLCTPYYGPAYERGYWPEIVAALEFLRRRIPDGRVWYGRDDGDWVREVTSQSLEELWSHWATHGGRPYYQSQRESDPT